MPKNTDHSFWKQRVFYQWIIGTLFVFFIWAVWYNHSTLPLTTVFAPILSPVSGYVYVHYVLPVADYYTTGEGHSPAFLPTLFVVFLSVAFIAWRVWYHFRQWKKSKTAVTTLLVASVSLFMLGANEPSVGIYDVQSKDDLLHFTAEDVRNLVQLENDRAKGARQTPQPHPILVHCFEERSFLYTGGKYDNAEIKYRLRVPNKIVSGKKYPLVVHLHGVGEAGKDNTYSLAHLHSILPLLIGPEQLDFFLLVLQCPADDRAWTFKKTKDGNLDVVVAAMEHVIHNNPIDEKRLSTFGLSSGGYGVWELITASPDRFAAAVPVSTTFPGKYKTIPELNQTPIWVFVNEGDSGVPMPPLLEAMRFFEVSNGYMKLTRLDQGGHSAWWNAMGEYNCFAWMIVQKRGGWFNPPPERETYQYRSLLNCFFAFFLPLGLAAGLRIFQRTCHWESLHTRITATLYNTPNKEEQEEYNDESNENAPVADEFRIWTDVAGTRKINAKVIGFQDNDKVRIQSPEGKIALALIKQFSTADQKSMIKMREQMLIPNEFRKWTDKTGKHTFTAKFISFQAEGKVLLQSEAGKTIAVPIDQLGQAEQDFVKRKLSR